MALFAELYRVDGNGLTLTACTGSMVSSISAVDVPLLDKAEPHPSMRSSLDAPNIPGLERCRGIFAFPNIRPQLEAAGTFRFNFALINTGRQSPNVSIAVVLDEIWSQDIKVEFMAKPSATPSSPPLIKETGYWWHNVETSEWTDAHVRKAKAELVHPTTHSGPGAQPEALYRHGQNNFQGASAANACAPLVMKPRGSLAPPAQWMWQSIGSHMQQPLCWYGPMPRVSQQPSFASLSSVQMTNNMATGYPPFQCISLLLADNFGFSVQAASFSQQTPSNNLRHPTLLKRYSSGFEDPFAESTMVQFDQVPAEGLPDSLSKDRDSKYLSFSMPQYNFTLLDDSFRRSSVNIGAQLHGMFFLAESQWPATADTPPPPPELTCYRRNLVEITGSVTLPRNLRYIFTDDGSRIPIYELELAVSATESVEGNSVKIISVPWKTPASGEATKPDDKVEREPPTIPLDKMSGQDLDTDFTTFPIQWKRLQFRIATANNGRRKELQQHFTLHLKIMALLSNGEKISIAEAHSGAVIVRGRSPQKFATSRDLPLGSSLTARKHLPSAS